MYDIERMAQVAHDAWLEEKLSRGVSTWPNEHGYEQMVPYADLVEDVREFDRVVVRAILDVLTLNPALAAPVVYEVRMRSGIGFLAVDPRLSRPWTGALSFRAVHSPDDDGSKYARIRWIAQGRELGNSGVGVKVRTDRKAVDYIVEWPVR